jgi:hypothetical protein
MTSIIESIFKPNTFLHLDTFPQGEDYNLDEFKLNILATKLTRSMINEFKWTEALEDAFQACNVVIFDDHDCSNLNKAEIESIIFENTFHLPNSQMSFVVVSLNLFSRKNERQIIESYIDELLIKYSTYARIFKFAVDRFRHEITK